MRGGNWIPDGTRLASSIALCALAFHLNAVAVGVGERTTYQLEYLVSDGSVPAPHEDAELINGWGLAASPTGPWWVAVNEMERSKLYDQNGSILSLQVSIPGPPTGIVYNGGTGFVITDGTYSGSALFLFASENGTISGWSPGVPAPAPSTHAFVAIDNSTAGVVYKGLAIASTGSGMRLYAADFRNAKVDVFDENFSPVTLPGAFVDEKIPAGFAPFGIQTLSGRIFVTYAKQDVQRRDEVAGQGLGFVNVFDTEGTLIARVATRGSLNAPWGLALAPNGFGDLSGNLLVGNFGDGRILAYSMTDDLRQFSPKGALRDSNRKPIEIDGLWGIAFGNGGQAGPPNALYFAAGPADESHGSFGRVLLSIESQ